MSELHYDRIIELEEQGLSREQLAEALREQLGRGFDDATWIAYVEEIAEEEKLDADVVAYLLVDC
jgi:hypothetical protein